MFRIVIRSILLFLFVVNSLKSSSTDRIDSVLAVRQYRINATFMVGFLAAHHAKMQVMMQRSILAGELDLGYKTNGKNNWECFYNYPEYGFAILYYDLGSPEYLGQSLGIQPYLSFPLLSSRQWGNLYFKAGVGVAYVSKKWDQYTNYKNTGIGSHINAGAKFELGASVKLSSSWYLNGGVSFSHISNGSTNNPNSGINMPSVNIGTTYAFGEKNYLIPYSTISFRKKLEYQLFISGSYKDIFPEGTGHYPVVSLSNYFYKPLKEHTGINFSWDIMYDESHWKLLQIERDSVSKLQLVKTGLALGYQFNFDRVALVFQMGYYIYTYYKSAGLFYQRLGLQYEFIPKVYFRVALRTSWSNADCIEFGFGYNFAKK